MSRKDNPGFLGTSAGDRGEDTTAFLVGQDKNLADYVGWFFGFAFAATAATIVSGAVAERIQFRAYLVYTAFITSFVYPVVAYWGWAGQGWLKVAGTKVDPNLGYLDFAGSGIVHMTGGCAALVAIIILGPRKFMGPLQDKDSKKFGERIWIPRFDDDGTVNDPPSHDQAGKPFCALGTLILWTGWYGFNCGSQLAIDGTDNGPYVGLAAVNTTLSAAAAVAVYGIVAGTMSYVDIGGSLNCALTGLVAITANCNYVQPWAAVLIGAIAAPVYIGSSFLLKRLQIDDVIDAVPVHFFGGIWGVLATGLLIDPDLCGTHDAGLFYDGSGLIGWQLIGIVAITAWTGALSALVFALLNVLGWLRASEEEEKLGIDILMTRTGQATLSTPESPRMQARKDQASEEEVNQLPQVDQEEAKPPPEIQLDQQQEEKQM